MKISQFKQTGSIELLLWLIEGELKITDIKERIRQETAYKALRVLLDFELIEIERREWNAKYYCLTEKGKKIALLLQEIEKILQSE